MTRTLLAACMLCASACGGETEGQSIRARWLAGSETQGEHNREFTTDTGWDVTLSEAFVAVGPIFAIAPAQDRLDAVASMLRHALVPVARAHGGHDAAGGLRVRAELLEPVALDALSTDAVTLLNAEAEAGAVDTMKIEIAQLTSDLPEELHGHQAYVRGRASRDAEQISFEGGLVELPDDEAERRVETPVDFTLEDGGAFGLSVNAVEWFRHAEFDQLARTADGVAQINPDDQVGRAWKVGVRAPAAFTVTFAVHRKD